MTMVDLAFGAFTIVVFMLGFACGRLSARPPRPSVVPVDGRDDPLVDRLEALRRARFASPVPNEAATIASRLAPPKVSPELVAKLKAPPRGVRKDK